MEIRFIPENDYDRLELGLITPEELGKDMAEKSLKKIAKQIRRI